MTNQEAGIMVFDQSLKSRKPKSREVSSRFLPSPTSSTPSSFENGIQSPSRTNSPHRQKPKSSSDGRKHKSFENSGFMRGLWPSSTTSSSQPPNPKFGNETLADHIGNDRLLDLSQNKNHEKSGNPTSLSRQRSCSESSRLENEKDIAKENHKPLFGGSMRYTGKFRFPGRSSNSSKSPNLFHDHSNNIVPGRLSVDETALRNKYFGKKSDYLSDALAESESEQSGTSLGSPVTGRSFPASYMAPTVSSRMSVSEVSAKHIQEIRANSRRWSADSSPIHKRISSDNSPKSFTLKNAIKRSNSLTTNVVETSKSKLSPGRSISPVSEENKSKVMAKPPTSPSRAKGVGNLLSIGLELLKGKKPNNFTRPTSPLGPTMVEGVHQLRLVHNRLAQWRYANARAETVNENITKQVESILLSAWDGLTKLRHSVRLKKLQLEKEKLEMKLNYILCSQIKSLEAWGDMERQHLSAVTKTKDCLHSVVYKVPLIEGAKVDQQLASTTLRDALDLTASMKLTLSNFPPAVDKTVAAFAELAETVAQEKLLLEECLELFKFIYTLEVQEMSLKCNFMQLKLRSEQRHHHQGHPEVSA